MEGYHVRCGFGRLVSFSFAAMILVAVLAACDSSASGITSLESSTGDSLRITVVRETSSVPSPNSSIIVFSRTIEDNSAIEQIRHAIESLAVVPPDVHLNCPMFVLPYKSYRLQFSYADQLTQVVTIDATQCAAVRVRDADKAGGITRCCPDGHFWTQLNQATGAPYPSDAQP